MTTIEDGGPAFPVIAEGGTDSGLHPTFETGLTMRDWFAGQALAATIYCHESGLIADGGPDRFAATAYRLAATAYDVADAMLRARRGDER